MRSVLRTVAALGLMISASAALAFNDGHQSTQNFQEVRRVIEEKISKYGADRVLIALDVDNTTLALEKDFGSEHWATWQSAMISQGQLGDGAVSRTIQGMFNVQSQVMALAPMRAVESEIPNELAKFGRLGARMMALTSRGLPFHDATIRELRRNGFPYETFAPGPKGGIAGSYIPLDLERPELSGLTAKDVQDLALVSVGPVMYQDGVFLTEGQHKGAMLRTLLHRLKLKFDAIVFIDDRLKHSEGMQAAFKDRRESVTTIQYAHNAQAIADWQAGDKQSAKQDWCEFSKAILTVRANPADADVISCP